MGDYSAYSRKELRGPDGIANKIILTREYPGKKFLSFLIVEGETDRNCYKAFVDEDKCQVTPAYNKSAAMQVLSILEARDFPGVLAIVDADFEVLEGKLLHNQNVLFTDTHDLETMIVKSPALEKVLNEFGSEEKIREFAQSGKGGVRVTLLECSIFIGYLRWISLQEKLSLKFEDLDFISFLDKKTLSVNLSMLVQTVKNKSQRHDITDLQLKASVQNVRKDTHDPWHVCCGHDLVSVLSIGLRTAIGTCSANDVKPDILERSLRLAYEYSHFSKTQLYALIQQWEKTNEPFVILKRE